VVTLWCRTGYSAVRRRAAHIRAVIRDLYPA